MNKLLYLAAAATIVAAALVLVAPIIVITTTTTASVAAINCQYAIPDPDLMAQVIEELTDEPVGQTQWDQYSNLLQLDTTYEDSTPEQRDQVLSWAINYIYNTSTQRIVTATPMIWWLGELPGENDESWKTHTIPGWDGTLETYMGAYTGLYGELIAQNTDEDIPCAPTNASLCPQPAHLPAILGTIRELESGNDYTERSRARVSDAPAETGWPSGAYQFLLTTWNEYDGYTEAWEAPPDVQDTRATKDITEIMDRFGDVTAVPLAWYLGYGGAADALEDPNIMNTVPNPEHNTLTPAEYRDHWMESYTANLYLYGVAANPCRNLGELVIKWAEGELGTPYASVSPYRFGKVGWPGGTLCASWGTCYTYPADTKVYDCSGFIITAWQQAGIDLTQWGIYASQNFDNPNLTDVTPTELQPGDIAVYEPIDGVGHVVLVHSNTNGDIRTIEATPSGVRIGNMNWERVTALKRVPTE